MQIERRKRWTVEKSIEGIVPHLPRKVMFENTEGKNKKNKDKLHIKILTTR